MCVKRKTHFFRDQHKNTEAINAALRKIKYRGEQKLTQYLLTEEDMTRISTFLTKLDIFSTTLGGDQYVTSSVLLPVIAAHCNAMQCIVQCSSTSTQAERVFSWVGFLLNKRRLSLSGDSVSMHLLLKDNLEL